MPASFVFVQCIITRIAVIEYRGKRICCIVGCNLTVICNIKVCYLFFSRMSEIMQLNERERISKCIICKIHEYPFLSQK